MGHRRRIHPRRRAEEIREILRHRGAKDCQEPAVGRGDMAEIRDQAPEEGTSARREPAQALLPVRRLSFPSVAPHGLLPVMINHLDIYPYSGASQSYNFVTCVFISCSLIPVYGNVSI